MRQMITEVFKGITIGLLCGFVAILGFKIITDVQITRYIDCKSDKAIVESVEFDYSTLGVVVDYDIYEGVHFYMY